MSEEPKNVAKHYAKDGEKSVAQPEYGVRVENFVPKIVAQDPKPKNQQTSQKVPATIILAWKLWLTFWVFSLADAVFTLLANKEETLRQILQSNEEISQLNINNLDNFIVWSAITVSTLFTVLLVFFTFRMKKGRIWARNFLLIFGFFHLFSFFINLEHLPNIILAVLVVAAIFFTLKSESAKFFVASKKDKNNNPMF